MKTKNLLVFVTLLLSLLLSSCAPSGSRAQASKPSPIEKLGSFVYTSIEDAQAQKNAAGPLQDFDIGKVNFIPTDVENVYQIILPQSPDATRNLSITYYYYFEPASEFTLDSFNGGLRALLAILGVLIIVIGLANVFVSTSQKVFTEEWAVEESLLGGLISELRLKFQFRQSTEGEAASAFDAKQVARLVRDRIKSRILSFSSRWLRSHPHELSVESFLADLDDFIEQLEKSGLEKLLPNTRLGAELVGIFRVGQTLDTNAQASERINAAVKLTATQITTLANETGLTPQQAAFHLAQLREQVIKAEGNDTWSDLTRNFPNLLELFAAKFGVDLETIEGDEDGVASDDNDVKPGRRGLFGISMGGKK